MTSPSRSWCGKELGHALLHDPTDPQQSTAGCRGTAEVEAESVAYLAAAHGLDTAEYTFGYITGWAAAAGDIDQILADTGRRDLAAAGQLVDATTDRPTATPDLAAAATAAADRTARAREDAEHILRRLDEPSADLARLHAAVAAAADSSSSEHLGPAAVVFQTVARRAVQPPGPPSAQSMSSRSR